MLYTCRGAHAFQPQCVESLLSDSTTDERSAVISRIELAIEAGICPRCLYQRFPPEHLSSSMATDCRCIPICEVCEDHEGYQDYALSPKEWPVDAVAEREELIAAYLSGEINTVHLDETGVSILPEPYETSPLYEAVQRARATNPQVPR